MPPPLPVADFYVPVLVVAPERAHIARSAADDDLSRMFDGAARRRRMAWAFALIALLAVAAMTIAAVASHFRPM